MEPPPQKFSKGELVRVKSKYPYGQLGLVVEVECHQMSGKDGWYAFLYRVLTSCGKVIEISESSLSKPYASASADTK